jgi:hypothetical protein
MCGVMGGLCRAAAEISGPSLKLRHYPRQTDVGRALSAGRPLATPLLPRRGSHLLFDHVIGDRPQSLVPASDFCLANPVLIVRNG